MRLIILAAVALTASAQTQTVDRTFQFKHADTAQSFDQLSALVRTIVDAPRVTIDSEEKSIGLRGTADQIALAEWLIQKLDPPDSNSGAIQEYTMGGAGENTVRIFYLPKISTNQGFAEFATLIRTVADIRRVFTFNAPRAMVVRGTADQIALAGWMAKQIEQQSPGEYNMPESSDPRGETAVYLFKIAHAETVQNFQELATVVRTTADIRRVFTYNEPRLMAVRGVPEQITLAQWLVAQLDQETPSGVSSPTYPYQITTGVQHINPAEIQSVVRVFYLHSPTVQELQQDATQIRTKTEIRRVFTYNALRAMVVRGSVDQIETADRMVKEITAPKQ